jgi:O-antigen/teichoic acid export membrane protein
MAAKQSSYRQIMKATTLFGGVQVFNIIISILRAKFIAVLLGPTGMGIAGLLTSTIGLIGSITNFGLGSSAVRNVSVAAATGEEEKIRIIVSVVRRLVWLTGLLGALATFALAPFLSEITFGDKSYTIAFMCISITLLLSQLGTGQFVIMQGLRKMKYLAKSNMTGMLLGLVISIPIYYKLGIKGIVPAIIISSFLGLFISWYFASKVKIANARVKKSLLKSESITMLKMGFMLSLNGSITMVASYVLRIFIARLGGVEHVGFYNSGFAIMSNYVGMIFTAMMTDYYPRLSEVSNDNSKTRNVINEQAEIAILLIAPALVGFLMFVDWLIILLYSHEFIVVNSMLHWAALGTFFQTASWAIGIVFLAKGAYGLFFWNELAATVYLLSFNVLGYKLLGLTGLGVSFLIGYIFFFLQIFIAAKLKYAFSFERGFYKLFLIQFLFGLLCFITIKTMSAPFLYFVGSALIFLSVLYSFFELNKRLDIRQIMHGFMNKVKRQYEIRG